MTFQTNLRSALLAATLWLGASAGAQAENWVPVSEDDTKAQYSIDASSIQHVGSYIHAWVKTHYATPQHENNVTYREDVSEAYFNCNEKSVAFGSSFYRDASGKVKGGATVLKSELEFASVPPASVAEFLLQQACLRGNLQPSVKARPDSPGDWKLIGSNAGEVESWRLLVLSVKNDFAVYTDKVEFKSDQKLDDGTAYREVLSLAVMNCKEGTFGGRASDYYDASGNLVFVEQVPTDKVEFGKIARHSWADTERKLLCASAGSAAAAQAQVSSGTGWLTHRGYVVTANHVVDGAVELVLLQDGKRVGTAQIVVADPANDVAVLRPKFEDGVHPAIALAEGGPRLGAHVFTLGYPAPDQLGLSVKMTSGEISSLAGADAASDRQDDARMVQISVPVQSGNSGGPVMDEQGRAVAMILSKRQMATEDEIAENVNYALKIGYVRALVADLPDVGGYRDALTSATMVDAASDAREAVSLVVATAP